MKLFIDTIMFCVSIPAMYFLLDFCEKEMERKKRK